MKKFLIGGISIQLILFILLLMWSINAKGRIDKLNKTVNDLEIELLKKDEEILYIGEKAKEFETLQENVSKKAFELDSIKKPVLDIIVNEEDWNGEEITNKLNEIRQLFNK